MENTLFYRFQYAAFAALYAKKQISEREFRDLTAPLCQKMREKDKDDK